MAEVLCSTWEGGGRVGPSFVGTWEHWERWEGRSLWRMPGNGGGSAPAMLAPSRGWEAARLHLYSEYRYIPERGGGPSPRRWCHLHLIHRSVLASDNQIAEEKESLSPRISHWADCLYLEWGLGDSGRAGGGQRWRRGRIPQLRRLDSPTSVLSWSTSLPFLPMGNRMTEGISPPCHHPQGPAQPGVKIQKRVVL